MTPVPSYPAAQASGAPIWGTLSCRSACTRPSSHSFEMPSCSVGEGSVRLWARLSRGAMEFQNVRTSGLAALSAAPRTDGRRRTRVLPSGALGTRSVDGCPGVRRDRGHVAAAGVVVPVGDQLGDVEQARVEPVGAEQADGLVGYDVHVVPLLLRPHPADGAGRALHVGDLLAVGQRGQGDDVTGDQRDLVHRRRDVAVLLHGGALGRGVGR